MGAVIVVVVAAAALYIVRRNGRQMGERYEFVEMRRGDLENVISSTGTLSAVGTVEVGTQVSGTIDAVLVDYNESVAKGRVLAVLDTTLLDASVRDARAGVLRSTAEYDQAVRDHGRNQELRGKNLISEVDLDDSLTRVQTTYASLLSAEASLDRAQANLGYAVIRSPIDGTVIMRNVEPGQTVAASFSTPTLFVIAEDLSEMEIHVLVDESDIGQIEVGQAVGFTVEAYMDDTFHGTVRQIWLQPEIVQNVVNYTVVVDASNEGGLLLPGMTATTDFVISEKHDVLLVPNAALRFEPTLEMMEEFRASMEKREAALPDSARQMRGAQGMHGGHFGGGPGALPTMPGGGEGNVARLWHVDSEGAPSVVSVLTGATDGRSTEIVRGPGVREGMRVISGVKQQEGESRSTRSIVPGPPSRRGRM